MNPITPIPPPVCKSYLWACSDCLGLGFRVCFRVRVWGFGFRVQGVAFRKVASLRLFTFQQWGSTDPAGTMFVCVFVMI